MRSGKMTTAAGFRVLLANHRCQAAQMILAPGDSEGGPDNRHRGSDQLMYIVSGHGEAKVDGRRHRLRPGSVLLIERREFHEIRNTGKTSLRTLNLYVPPAYRRNGTALPRGQP
jgi:mannose-6-phosphate isomerase-like protein (cupin superfamily)